MKTLFALTAVLVLVAVAAPLALADATPQGITIITDTLGGNGHALHAQPQSISLITDTLGGNGGVTQPVTTTVFRDPGFSWADAGIGAAAVAGSLLVALGGVRLLGRRRTGLAI